MSVFQWFTVKNITNTVKSYPIIPVAIGGFTSFYLLKSLRTYYSRKQKNEFENSDTYLIVRLSNNILCIGSIIGIFAVPILFSALPKLTLKHAICLGTLQAPFWWFIDYFTSPTKAAYHNYQSMIANGYSKTKILMYNIISVNMIFLSMYGIVRSFGVTQFNSWKHQHWNIKQLIKFFAKIALNLCLSDIIFHRAHKWLHFNMKYPNIHLMHHACFTAGPSVSICFNPIDTILEYAPIYIPTLICYAANKDKYAAICSISAAFAWYHCDHDENLATHHYRHHSFISCFYTAYIPYKEKSIEKDHVRKALAKGYGYRRSIFIDDK